MTFDKYFIKKLIAPIKNGDAIGTFSKEEFLQNKHNTWAVFWNINRGLPKDRMHSKDYPDTQKVFRAIKRGKFDEVGGFNEKAGYTDDWTLSEKLNTLAVSAPGAIFYHKNPDSLNEVFLQSKWMGKRKYKLGILGLMIALFRVSFPMSIINGLSKSVLLLDMRYLVFKVVSDLGLFVGILEFVMSKKVVK